MDEVQEGRSCHVQGTFIQPLASHHHEQGLIQGLLSLLLSLLAQDSWWWLYNSIEYHIIYISTYIHNCFYYNATHLHEDIRSGPSSLHSSLIASIILTLFVFSSFCFFLFLISHKKLARKRKHLPNWTVNSLLPKISSWRHSMQVLLFPSIFLSAHMMIFFQEICPIPF